MLLPWVKALQSCHALAVNSSVPNIHMIMFDALSRQHFKRKMPATVSVLQELHDDDDYDGSYPLPVG